LHHFGEIGQIIAQLDDRDEVKLSQDLCNEVNRRFLSRLLSELANVPRRDVQRLIDLACRNSGFRNSAL